MIDLSKLKAFADDILTLYHTVQTFNDPGKRSLSKTLGKGENAGKQYFLLSPQCFQSYQGQIERFERHLFCCVQMLSIWWSPNFCCLVKC